MSVRPFVIIMASRGSEWLGAHAWWSTSLRDRKVPLLTGSESRMSTSSTPVSTSLHTSLPPLERMTARSSLPTVVWQAINCLPHLRPAWSPPTADWTLESGWAGTICLPQLQPAWFPLTADWTLGGGWPGTKCLPQLRLAWSQRVSTRSSEMAVLELPQPDEMNGNAVSLIKYEVYAMPPATRNEGTLA